MYKEFRRELMAQVLEKDIVNIYYNDGKEVQKITISSFDTAPDSYKPNQIKFKTMGFIIQEGPIRAVWRNYANITKIEVFG